MCGIAGWVRREPGSTDPGRLARMCDVQRHRGPDDAGLFVSTDGRVGLGHRRLSILDLSERGHQPMCDEAGALWITYNGEIYNFALIRRELEQLGHAFRSASDTEVILHAWRQWGPACLDRFNGMFAFAIYEPGADRVVLVRDRFGVKPLYYAWDGGTLVFASEIKAILAAGVPARVRREGVAELMLFSGSTGAGTLFDGIVSLRPGRMLTVSLRDGAVTERAFYVARDRVDPARYAEAARLDDRETAAGLREALTASVERRLVSDVPVGTFCSGGLDSSVVTAIARRLSSDVKLFTVSSKGFTEMDELDHARAVARHVGAELIVYEVDRTDLQRGFVDATYFNDNPLAIVNSIPMFHLSTLARDHGVKVLLSGEGADELFGGYDWRHRALLRAGRVRRRLASMPRTLRNALRPLAASEALHAHRFRTLERNIDHALNFIAGGFERWEERRRDTEAYAFVDDPAEREVLGAMLADLRDYLEPLLMRQDRMTMAASVECRVPFVDYRLVELGLNLPLAARIRGRTGKWILRQVARDLVPATIVRRPKAGFPVPAAAFLYDHLDFEIFSGGFWERSFGLPAGRCRDVILAAGRDSFVWYQLLMLEVWGRLFLHGESREEIQQRAFQGTGS